MSIKKTIAEKGLSLDQGKASHNLFMSAVIGAFAFIPSMLAVEFLPMDDTVKPGADIAVQEYDAALDILTNYDKDKPANAAPSSLSKLLSHGAEAGDAENVATQSFRDTEAFKELSYQFGEALIVDQRLSEVQKYDLVQEFESRVGDFEKYTGLDEPDYADLDEATARLTPEMDDRAFAENIVELSYKVNQGPTAGKISGGVFLALMLLSSLAGANRGRLKSWVENEKYKKPPKFPH